MSDIENEGGEAAPEIQTEGSEREEVIHTRQPASREEHDIVFAGDPADIIPIAIKNLIFNILTLSLYRFWGRTEVRRHIWSQIRVKGDPLEYTGTGGEMFIGFLLVMLLVFTPLTGLVIWAQLLLQRGDVALGGTVMAAVYLVFLWLMPLAIYRAQRYRLSRTRWRGVRGSMQNNGYAYATQSLLYSVLLIVTLGLTYPYVANKLWSMETNDRRFGSGAFSYGADSGPLYKIFLIAFGLILLFVYAPFLYLASDIIGLEAGQQPDGGAVLQFFMVYLWALIVGPIIFAFFYIAQLEHFWGNMFFEGAQFSFHGTVGGLIKLHIVNILISGFTFGVLGPLVQLRTVRFMVDNVTLTGPLDLATITQSDQTVDKFGEGLAEGFDIGTI